MILTTRSAMFYPFSHPESSSFNKLAELSPLSFLQQAELNRMASPYAALTASAYLLCFPQKPARLSINKQEP
jgi:hypothetical protein